MSCNGCRVLRKGCTEECVLRQSLRGVVGPQAQSHATLFVAKFFGRATLLSFISAVPQPHRPALFQSLLFEAVGRTINPVGGVVGLLWTGHWQLCQSAVDTVLRGGTLQPLPELSSRNPSPDSEVCSESAADCFRAEAAADSPVTVIPPWRSSADTLKLENDDLGLSLKPAARPGELCRRAKKRRAATPLPGEAEEDEEESRTTGSGSGLSFDSSRERALLRLFI